MISKTAWYREQMPSFVPQGDVPADCVRDLKTSENKLSVWHIEDDRSNLSRTVTALASVRQYVAKFDYLLYRSSLISESGIEFEASTGGSGDAYVNSHWHRDLVDLSGRKLIELAIALFYDPESKTERVQERNVLLLLRDSVERKELDPGQMSEHLRRKIESAS